MRLEAQACARIRHDNLVAVHDFGGALDGRVFLVMDRLHGRSLADELQARTFLPSPKPSTSPASRSPASRPLTPPASSIATSSPTTSSSNTPLRPAPREGPRLGVAKIVRHATTPLTPAPFAQPTADGMTVGTARWSSPEQSRGLPDIDARSGVYSTGWVLRAMLTGEAPFPKAHDSWRPVQRARHPGSPSPVRGCPAADLRRAGRDRDEGDREAQGRQVCERGGVPGGAGAGRGLAGLRGRSDGGGVALSAARTSPAPVQGKGTTNAASPTLVATVEQAPLLAGPPLPGHTVATPEVAIGRPTLPWAARPQRPATTSARPVARLPLWFVVVVVVGVGGTVAAVAMYLWGATG